MVAVDTVDVRNANYLLNKIKNNSNVLPENKDIVLKYYNEKLASGYKVSSMVNALKILSRIALAFKTPFPATKKEQLIEFFNTLKPDFVPLKLNGGKEYVFDRQSYSPVTILRMKTQAKTFWKWLAQNYKVERNEYGIPVAVAWIKGTEANKNNRFKKDVLSREEIQLMIKNTPKARNKAMIAILFESGMSAGELLSMRRSGLETHDEFCEFICDGKTGKRPVVLVQSWPYLKQWLEEVDQNKDKIREEYQDFVWFKQPEFGKDAFSPVTSNGIILDMIKQPPVIDRWNLGARFARNSGT